ncbi:MAG: twin-arginine translocation pathway signal protein, partial [Gammaproteobacteria bacterium]|nr:twin-arginine translocation pathway signal protein [Gammaproteobacteria bacterium]
IYPSQNKEYCADIFLWYKESYIGEPKDEELLNNIKEWVNSEWPFKKVNYVGRK